MRSHSSYSGVAQAAGAAFLLGAAAYAGLTSAIVWRWGDSPKRVLLVHSIVLGLGLLVFLGPRLAFLR